MSFFIGRRNELTKDVIEINKSLIPYRFNIILAGQVFEIGVKYNEFADLFTISLSKDNELICSGEPIIYGVPLFNDLHISGKYPALKIVPFDDSKANTYVSWDNFQQTVFLIIDNGSDEIE